MIARITSGPLTGAALGAVLLFAVLSSGTRPAVSPASVIHAVGAENFYANVIAQIGGSRVAVVGIISNPAIDPHTYESSTRGASAVARADLVVQNGLGYDAFMQKLESASPRSARTVLDVGTLLGYKMGANPHVWYSPSTMPHVASWIAGELTQRDPAHKALFQANLRSFRHSLQPLMVEVAALHRRFKGTPVAVSEPVFGYAAAAIGLDVRTTPSFQLAVMQGNDPSPQDVQAAETLLTQARVKVFIYNRQAVVPITVTLLQLAHIHHIPVIGVYESMPLGMSYQRWMIAETEALDRALSHGVSTERLP